MTDDDETSAAEQPPARTMKLCYLTRGDPSDLSDWSGTPYWTVRHLRARGHTVDVLRGEPKWARWLLMPMKGLAALFGRHYLLRHSNLYLRLIAPFVRRTLRRQDYEAVFSQDMILAAAVRHPKSVYWCDAELKTLYDTYLPGYWARTWNGREAMGREHEALTRSYRVFCASNWAADGLARAYPEHRRKLVMAPFPENMPTPEADAVERAIAGRSAEEFRLLFIGVDWMRKGGDRALELVQALRARGVPAMLNVVGCVPFGAKPPPFVRQLGFIDKSSREGLGALRAELLAAHFLVLPSRAEAMGIALVEAHAHGVPTIASDVGGITSVVERGVNGFAFPFTDVAPIAKLMEAYWQDQELYRGLARSARHTFTRQYSAAVRMAQIEAVLTPDSAAPAPP